MIITYSIFLDARDSARQPAYINLFPKNMFDIFYYKPPRNNLFLETLENIVDRPQQYIPIYKNFFDLNETNYNKIILNQKYHIVNGRKIVDSAVDAVELGWSQTENDAFIFGQLGTSTPDALVREKIVFIKFSPVLDPIKFMIGKYDLADPRVRTLPSINSTEEDCLGKVLDTNNSSYIDGFFTYLTSQLLHNHGFIHGIDYYGSYMGIQKKYKMNVVEDLEYLQKSKFFRKNIGVLFDVENIELDEYDNSRNCKSRLVISDFEDDLSIDDLNIEGGTAPAAAAATEPNAESIYEKTENDDSSYTDSSLNYTSDNDDDASLSFESLSDFSEDDDDDESKTAAKKSSSVSGAAADDESSYTTITDSTTDDVDIITATIYDFPVHLICLEKCEDTLDKLMEENGLSQNEWKSALMQVIMSLIVLQKSFHLTHNDLHTNNIMYIKTPAKYIYYKIENQYFRVPTHGRIFKIIDFGRAIYTFRGRVFCSDSFDFGGDAAGQYNFPPYLDDKKPTIEPNYSFDLCRLGCSMYDIFIDDENPETDDLLPVQNLIYEWCCDDNGKNVLYKSSGEERYPDFKLYKMIARTVHKHTPLSQLSRPIFRDYLWKDGTSSLDVMKKGLFVDIDSIPCYA
jgi:hypothetical protein